MDNDFEEIKMILLGESGVGKTAIIKRYLYDQFNEEKSPSDSMHYVEKDLVVKKKKDKIKYMGYYRPREISFFVQIIFK